MTGDLFEREGDLENPSLWRSFGELPDLQERSRQHILELADFIVPGHWGMFAVPGKRQRLGPFGFQRYITMILTGASLKDRMLAVGRPQGMLESGDEKRTHDTPCRFAKARRCL